MAKRCPTIHRSFLRSLRSLRALALAFSLAAAGTAGCATSTAAVDAEPRASAGPKVGKRLPSFKVKDFEGNDLALAAYKGKVVLVDIWASWCAPCKEELPLLDAMARRLERKGVAVIAVSIDEDRDDAVRFLESQPKWALAVGHDPEARLGKLLKPAKMPTSYIVDRGGIVRKINEGFQRSDAVQLEAALTELADQDK